MEQIHEVWAQIQTPAPAPASAPAPAAVAPQQAANLGASAPAAVASNAMAATATATATGTQTELAPSPEPPAAAFIERGRYEAETQAAQRLDDSLQGVFEPTAHSDLEMSPSAAIPLLDLEFTSVAMHNNPNEPLQTTAQDALCIDCGVSFDRGRCPVCGRLAR